MEDRLAVLDGDHPAGGEGAAVADAVDRVDDRRAGSPGRRKYACRECGGRSVGDRAARGDQGLRGDLAAEDPRDDGGAAAAAEDVLLDLLQVEQIEQDCSA